MKPAWGSDHDGMSMSLDVRIHRPVAQDHGNAQAKQGALVLADFKAVFFSGQIMLGHSKTYSEPIVLY